MQTGTVNLLGHALTVAGIVLALVAYWYFRHRERQRRLEIVHKERLVAMEKGIPLPELPLDPPKVPKPPDPRDVLIHGLVWTAFGAGGMVTLAFIGPLPNGVVTWPLPVPLLFLGLGLILYYVLASERAR